MSRARSVALVCAGKVSRSDITRIPKLRDCLAWVKGTSLRVASRAANSLGAGKPTDAFSDLRAAKILLISVPSALVEATVQEMLAADENWQSRTVALFNTTFDSSILQPLSDAGAHAISIHSIAGYMVVEGSEEGTRIVTTLLRDRATKFIPIGKGRMQYFRAAVDAAESQFIPLVATVVDSLAKAGLGRAESQMLATLLLENTRNYYFRVGKRALGLYSPKQEPS
jgi:hypothetical protein